MNSKIENPILRGFHPDPSIIRVGEDYYIATSTFEWWPGVRLHHSRDLIHWELIGYPLDRTSQLDLRGVGSSQGVWAPCLTYDKGVFYLVYTVVTAFYCNMYDTNNYLVTATDIHGPWSEPQAFNNFGFDPSLFHDEDGRKYIVSMATDHRVPKKYAGRLILQEYDTTAGRMTGPVRDIYRTDRIFLEGPHIFKRNGWYYLFSADTGTGEGHGQTIQRSRCVWGPYEMYRPQTHADRKEGDAYSILTSRYHPEWLLQKAGHCDLVETQDGEWYAVHLCGRPSAERNPPDAERFPGHRRYMLGRETAIQKVRWTQDGWLELEGGDVLPQLWVDPPKCAAAAAEQAKPPLTRDEFDRPELDLDYQSLRVPMDGRHLSLTARPGWLRMYGRSGLSGLRLYNSASWTTAFLDSRYIWADGLDIRNEKRYNGDGLDFDGCSHVFVSNCCIRGTDDNLCLQSSSRQYPVRDIHVANCSFSSVCAAVRIGLKSIGDISQVVIQNCTTDDVWREGVKIECSEGGSISDILIDNIAMHNVRRPVFLLLYNRFEPEGLGSSLELTEMPEIGRLERISLSNISAADDMEMAQTHRRFGDDIMGSPQFNGVRVDAAPGCPIRDVVFRNFSYTAVGGVGADAVPAAYPAVVDRREQPGAACAENYYPDWSRTAFLDIRNVDGLTLEGVVLRALRPDARPPVLLEGCRLRRQEIRIEV